MNNPLSASYASGMGIPATVDTGGDDEGGLAGAAGVVSMTLHPDKYKTQMLALTLNTLGGPTALRMYNTSTYKVQAVCAGGSIAGGSSCPPSEAAASARGFGSSVFCRSALSGDYLDHPFVS